MPEPTSTPNNRPPCSQCSSPMMSNGTTSAGNKRYRCKCGHTLTDSANPWGSLPEGDRPMTTNERQQRWAQNNPDEAKRQNRERQKRFRERKKAENKVKDEG